MHPNVQYLVEFYFRFPHDWAAVGKEDQLCLALSDHFQTLLVPQHALSTFHNELEPSDVFVFFEATIFLH